MGRTNREVRSGFYAVQKSKCAFCGKFCVFDDGDINSPVFFTLEHVVPKRFGGKRFRNVVGSCRKCNVNRAQIIDLAPKSEHSKILERCKAESQLLQSRYTIWN